MASELFVYWRVAAADAVHAEAAAAALQRELRLEWPGLHARLYRRAEAPAGLLTLMETYALEGHATAWRDAVAAHAAVRLGAWCQGQRHVEVFDRIEP